MTIHELEEQVAEVIGFKGSLTFDTSKPDSTMRKVMDVSHINALCRKDGTSLKDGISSVYKNFALAISNSMQTTQYITQLITRL